MAIDPMFIWPWFLMAVGACAYGFIKLLTLWAETEKVQDPADLYP